MTLIIKLTKVKREIERLESVLKEHPTDHAAKIALPKKKRREKVLLAKYSKMRNVAQSINKLQFK